jgi:hypothetical protein
MDGVKSQSLPLHTDFSKAVLWWRGLEGSRRQGSLARAQYLTERGGLSKVGVSCQNGRVLFRCDIRVAQGKEFPQKGLIFMESSSWGPLSGTFELSLGILELLVCQSNIHCPNYSCGTVPNFMGNALSFLILTLEPLCSGPALKMVKLK